MTELYNKYRKSALSMLRGGWKLLLIQVVHVYLFTAFQCLCDTKVN